MIQLQEENLMSDERTQANPRLLEIAKEIFPKAKKLFWSVSAGRSYLTVGSTTVFSCESSMDEEIFREKLLIFKRRLKSGAV